MRKDDDEDEEEEEEEVSRHKYSANFILGMSPLLKTVRTDLTFEKSTAHSIFLGIAYFTGKKAVKIPSCAAYTFKR